MSIYKITVYPLVVLLILLLNISILSCDSGLAKETKSQTQDIAMQSDSISVENLFQQGQYQENLGNYSDAIQLYEQVIVESQDSYYTDQAYESIPRCRYFWGLRLEGMGKYSAEQIGGAIEQYNLILQQYPNSQYAMKLKRLSEDDPKIGTIAGVEFNINSHFKVSVINKSTLYIVELIVYIQLYQDVNQVYYKSFVLNGIGPGEERNFEESPWIPLYGWDNLIWSFTEILLREI